jgi:hemin uptake protein HemP
MDTRQNNSAVAHAPQMAMAGTTVPMPVLLSRELFRNSNTVQIEHDGQHYLLRLTRGNKLILTK